MFTLIFCHSLLVCHTENIMIFNKRFILLISAIICISHLSEAGNFSSLFNPVGFLQEAGKTVMSKLLRTSKQRVNNDARPVKYNVVVGPNGEMSERVATLVTNGLGHDKKILKKNQQPKQRNQQQHQQQTGGGGLFGGFMRLLGLDSSRLGAIAINAFVYISEVIAATLTRMRPTGKSDDFKKPEGTPFSWLLDNPGPKIATALKLAQDNQLPEVLISLLKGRHKRSMDDDSNLGSTYCLQRLMCQLSPVLWGMQEAVSDTLSDIPKFKDNTQTSASTLLWNHLPSKETLRVQGEKCEERFPECELPQSNDF